MNWVIIGIACGGVVWIIVCLHQGFKTFVRKHPKVKKVTKKIPISDNPFWRDAIISIIIVLITCRIFPGVTGMIIGLGASVIVSIYLWIAIPKGGKNEINKK